MDFPQELGSVGGAAQPDPQDPFPDLAPGGSVNTPMCVEVQSTSELVHCMTAAAKNS